MWPWILMYHSVAAYERDPYLVTVRPEHLDAQLWWMRRRGLVGVGLGELLSTRRRGMVALTFDDGYRDFAEEAVPLLRRHGFRATVFVIAGLPGGHNRWDPDGEHKDLMTADEVRAVADAGMEIGAHGMTHVRLGAGADLDEEVAGSRAALTRVVGRPIPGFCYPYGAHDDAAVLAVRRAGFGYACATGRPARPGRFALPRTYVGDVDGALRLEAKRARHLVAEARGAVGTARSVPARTPAGAAGPG
ncbi:polysaccharide deacetylase family protein [Actinomycetospora endophytica]|uniref:Polysaccharide deacetylase family protein n=1 Tax=Actinomycetospora endophytica TaxID=2291215 RepID=A0ABS8PCQ3_9PSEU|nr:polysaccharide deacetylase family protein [Actinomycetospora endophytica]MCD2195934.1 polysaccharide deacetylase family protein [Actinomycetospora endophytica]